MAACARAPAPPTPAAFVRSPAPAQSSGGDELARLNDVVRTIYSRAKARERAAVPAVIVAQNSELTLLHGSGRASAPILPPVYHTLKVVDHVGLGLHVLLARADGMLDETTVATLSALSQQLERAQEAVARSGLTPAQTSRQLRIFAEARLFARRALATKRVDRAELVAFDRTLAPLLLENVFDAARAQLDAIHAAVTSWRAQLSEAEWRGLRVVVTGPHMARQGNVMTQYFTALLGEGREEGGRVIYAEAVSDETRALDLLATHLVDGDLSFAFFEDPDRMHRDLLSDAARAYVLELVGQFRTPR